jgi:hypothetical protein
VSEMADVGAWVLGGTGISAIVILLIKKLIIDSFSGKSQIVNIQAGDNLINRLQGEITRLEEIIKKQSKRIDELEERIGIIHDLEVQDAADIAELTILLDTACKECPMSDHNIRMTGILDRLRNRKAVSRTKGSVKVVTISEAA